MGEHLHEAEGLARTLGDQHRLGRIATFIVNQCLYTGDYDEAVRFGQEALSIARTLGDRSIEVVATTFLGNTHAARGEFSDAATFLERHVALEGDLRSERFGAPQIQSALSGACLADVCSQLGRFDEAIAHAEAAVRIAKAADHPLSLFPGVFYLGVAHLRRGDSRARPGSSSDASTSAERGSSSIGHRTSPRPLAPPTPSPAVLTRRARWWRAPSRSSAVVRSYVRAGRSYFLFGGEDLPRGRADRRGRRLGARASEAHALCLAGDVASAGGAEDAPGHYREALALASELGMRPLVAHCHRGLGTLYATTGQAQQAYAELAAAIDLYRSMEMTFWLPQTEAALAQVSAR